MHAWKVLIPPDAGEPEIAPKFDTGLPHWFGPAGDEPVESLSLLGRPARVPAVRTNPSVAARPSRL